MFRVCKHCFGSFLFEVKNRSKRSYGMVRAGKLLWVFLAKNMVKKGYCRNEGFGFAWDHIRLP